MISNRSFVFALLVVVAAAGPAFAVDLMKYLDRPAQMYATPTVLPMGWSADGNFAFSSVRALEGIGGERHEFTIVSAVTDEVLFYRRVDMTFEPDDAADFDAATLEAARAEWEAALRLWQIEQGAGIEFMPLPAEFDGTVYEASVTVEPEPEEILPMDAVQSYEVFVHAAGYGSKRITRGDDVMANDMWIAGCFKSPFEPRMLVVIAREQYVFEGTEAFFEFSGAHLVHGYR